MLEILAAAYGLGDVTARVKDLVDRGTLKIPADNNTFPDTWIGTKKSLVIVYRFDEQAPQVATATEGSVAEIKNLNGPKAPTPQQSQLTILGAAYGPKDVTGQVRAMVDGNHLKCNADNVTFGDTWNGITKSLVIVFNNGDKNELYIAKERETVQIGDFLEILGATYGPYNETETVRALAGKRSATIRASNDTFPDHWVGVKKTLVVTYRYGSQIPSTAIAAEGNTMTIKYAAAPPDTIMTAPDILGAAYGLADVTNRVKSLVNEGKLPIKADNATFTDTWVGIKKSLTIVYRNAEGKVQVASCKENESIAALK